MQSKATTVAKYLAELPVERRRAIEAVRSVILQNLGEGYEEGMQYGMIGYYVPKSLYPEGYHCDPNQPLCFAGLGSQKNHLSLYLMGMYASEEDRDRFIERWKKTGKKLDVGKVCIRFKRAEDVPLEVIGNAIRSLPVAKFIRLYEQARDQNAKARPSAKKAAAPKKKAKKAPAAKKKAPAKKAKRR